jgi:hypothetical protein
MSYVVNISRGGIYLADGAALGEAASGAMANGALLGAVRNGANDAAPIIGGIPDVQLFNDLILAAGNADINAYTRESFAAVLGTLAGLVAMPLGPLTALGADQAFSEAFKYAYDKVGDWSRQRDWSPLFDQIDKLLDKKVSTTSANDGINLGVNGCYRDAKSWRAPVDPLMLDLDGDGLELSRASGSILFDHNADGIKTGTGWIGSEDGILVRDLNGDGSITSGRELFGIDTLKSNGQYAANGFDALADLDSNGDGQFTSADAAWNSVQVWRDLDQDGISDAGELFGLNDLGISRIGVTGSATNATGGTQAGSTVNGNFIALSASFSLTTAGVTTERSVGAVDLEVNNFYREYTTHVALTAQAQRRCSLGVSCSVSVAY